MGILSPYGGNLPPEVAAEVDKIVSKMVSKVEPEMQEIVLLLKQHGIPGTSIELQMGSIPSGIIPSPFMMPPNIRIPVREETSSIPANDLVEGICKILNVSYEGNQFNILGMVFDHNHNVAYEISKVMEAARKRDRESLAKELKLIAERITK